MTDVKEYVQLKFEANETLTNIFDKREKFPIPSLGNSAGQSFCGRKSAYICNESDIHFRLQLRVNQHAFHSFRVRNHAGIGPLRHFIIATISALHQNKKGIFVAGGPFGALRGRGPLVFELKVTLVRYATGVDFVLYACCT